MGRIMRLESETVERIAAGEVVERPAAALKELVENSLDAGAQRIRVEVRGAGLELLQISDDGCGMDREDVLLSVERHATSKIRHSADLDHITTLGFRGEALSSIAAVSRLEILTRMVDLPTGWRVVMEGGNLVTQEEAGCPAGTTVAVRDLFFNTPARKKFLKSAGAEQSHVMDYLGRLALSRPEVAFTLYREGTRLFASPGTGDARPVLRELLGAEAERQLVPVEAQEGNICLFGFTGTPGISRGNRNGEYFFLNGRLFQNASLRYHAEAAYQSLLPERRYPILALFLELPPEEVDVNVHPTKAEVRFSDPQRVGGFLQRAIGAALGRRSLAPSWDVKGSTSNPPPTAAPPPAGFREAAATYAPELPLARPAPEPALRHDFASWRLLGQFNRTYLLAEDDEQLFLIDQHAAHERIWYEKLSVPRPDLSVQELLIPLSLPVTPRELLGWEANRELLAAEGFNIELFGSDTLLVRAIPADLEEVGEEQTLRDLLEHLAAAEAGEGPSQRRDRLARRLAACKAAVKAHQELSPGEARALLAELSRATQPYTCPHGRPTVIGMSVAEIARRFGR